MRADYNGALISSTLANINRGKDSSPFSVSDFMVYGQEEKEDNNTLSDLDRKILNWGSR